MYRWLLLLLPLSLFGNYFKERLLQAEVGDYVVTEYQEVMSMLRVSAMNNRQITLEEISVPWHIMRGKSNWKKWLADGAQGHSSWIVYTIDLEKHTMVSCFSPSRDAYLTTADSLVSEFLDLKLTPVSDADRKRVGPPPLNGPDTRNLWTPALTYEGKKKYPDQVSVFRAKLPKSDTVFSEKEIDLYFDHDTPFPYWIQIQNRGPVKLKVRSIDSGKGAHSPL